MEEDMLGDSSLCVHGGQRDSKWKKTVCFAAVNEFNSLAEYESSNFRYRRYGSPNVEELGTAIACLEGAESGVATASGMGAILLAILCVCKQGDTVVASHDAYGGTYDLLSNDMERFGIHVRLGNLYEDGVLESILLELDAKTKRVVVLIESISNPLIKVANLPEMAQVCRKHGCLLIVDNTFTTPIRTKPLKEGADMVVHSATKFLCGHSDAVAGALVGACKYIEIAKDLIGRWGLAASPMDAWLVMRGLKTLEVRMKRSWETASIVAKKLADSGIQVRYASQCSIVAFEVPGGIAEVEAALQAFRLIKLSPSLGGVSTTVSHSASSSHKALPPQQRLHMGITDGLLRMSVGLEDIVDIWMDIKHGLNLNS